MKLRPNKTPTAAAPGWLARLAQGLRGLFRRQAEATAAAEVAPATRQAEADGQTDERLRWKAACTALTLLLGKHPSSRTVFRQLSTLEQMLLDHGPRIVDKLPLDLLERALQQLETLVTDWSAADLAYLRSSIGVVVTARQRAERHAAQDLSVLVTPDRLQVKEASDSVYQEFQHHFVQGRHTDPHAA